MGAVKNRKKARAQAERSPARRAARTPGSRSVRGPKPAQPQETISVNPATLEEIGRVAHTDLATMPDLFRRARHAQRLWAETPVRVRARHIIKMRNYIRDNAEELSAIVSGDNGKSRIDALATEVLPCALAANWYAKHTAEALAPRTLPLSTILFFNKRNRLIRVPLGVVGIISPWNYPLSIPFGEVVMGLMAGNAIMMKVAAATVQVGVAIERIVAAGELPPDLFHHIVGSGAGVSRAFFDNGVNKIFFTGSVPVGKQLMAAAAPTLTPLSLELGGKDPMIVLEDADLERAANGAAWAGYQNAGQSCGGVERIYVEEAVYEPFVQLLAEKTRSMRHGVDRAHDVEMGSMTTKDQLALVEGHVKDAVKRGARIEAQSRANNDTKGYFYPATLMTGVDHSMPLMREETFGPVLPVMKFRTIEEAIELANDSTMALTSSVWTGNLRRGRTIAARLESGVTTINDHLYTHGQSETPWGGWKESGLGRTHSLLGIDEMTQPKVINWDMIPSRRNIWWFPFDRPTYEAMLSALRFVFPTSPFAMARHGMRLTVYMVRKMFTPWKSRASTDS